MTDWYWEAAIVHSQAAYANRDGSLANPWVLGPSRFGINPGAMDISVFRPGDTLWVMDTHLWTNFDTHFSASSLSGLTIRGDYPGRPGSIFSISLPNFADIAIYSIDLKLISMGLGNGLYCTGCVIHHNTVGLRVNRLLSCSDITIVYNIFHDLSSAGMQIFTAAGVGRDNWFIGNNEIYNVALNATNPQVDGEGIGIQRMTNSVINNNHIHHCDYGINIWEGGSGTSRNLEISGNHVHDIVSGPASWPSRGIMFSGGSLNPASFQDIRIHHNLVYNIGKEGIRLPVPGGSTGLDVYGNVVANVNTEYGTPNSEYIVAPAPWNAHDNHLLSAWAL